MSEAGVGRVRKDQVASLIIAAASDRIDETVFVNGYPIATEGATMQGPPNPGDVIVTCDTTVYADYKKVSIEGSVSAQGYDQGRSSSNVFAGNGEG